MEKEKDVFKGRGAQVNTHNDFINNQYVQEHYEGLDEEFFEDSQTQYFAEYPKKLINKVDSPDVGSSYSMNPYQGCEHGCIYCYARNSHQYWGFSGGLDFERKIIIKENIASVLEKQLKKPNWEVRPIMLAGNTDCYQPIERKKMLTRKILELLVQYRHPVGLITKNSLILRDIDLLQELNKLQLVNVSVSITTLQESIRRKLEPRTTTIKQRLQVVETLSNAGIPVNVMVAPIIPGLNAMEIPEIIKAVAERGAKNAAYTIVRLNGVIGEIFTDWVHKSFPDRADKILNQIKACHNGKLNDSRYGKRMRGEGQVAESIRNLFMVAKRKYMKGRVLPFLNCDAFIRVHGTQTQINF